MTEKATAPLAGRHIVLGVSGTINKNNAADLCSKLRQAGAEVEVVMTSAATNFVGPATFQSLSGRPVVADMFEAAEPEAHVEVARRADALVIAPATADCLANLAQGRTSDMVTLTALATSAPVIVAPAMDSQMWENPATQSNVDMLRQRLVYVAGPREGRLATGRMGSGRMVEVPEIISALRAALGKEKGDLVSRYVVVSAGPTYEPIDPVRFIGNRSSGKMGFAIAEAARDRGARVTLVTGPSSLETPFGIQRMDVETVGEMLTALRRATADADALVMAAAPADFEPVSAADQKIKKAPGEDGLTLKFKKTPDILASLELGGVRVGFAAETENLESNAVEKLERKRLDFIVANDVTVEGSGFATETNRVTIFHSDGAVEELPLMSKYDVANAILDRILARVGGDA
ncbi:MAG TPA: bifunctional phosphopantothenoylcysteine decarboxylase/phosphopantothenate--cysteine ligase CoaBC [Dehalococcoidia bacterium]|nr:bifunctional phosphopantothenoylcysteine decarboxylase/phosphopantothenate--cysteine ligase CoaBC [Dehalococcoidia bacterium]